MTEESYRKLLQSLLEDRSTVLYNLEQSHNKQLLLNTKLHKINEAIAELKRKKDEYIGNRESDY